MEENFTRPWMFYLLNKLKESTSTDGRPGAARYEENEVVNLVGEAFKDLHEICPSYG